MLKKSDEIISAIKSNNEEVLREIYNRGYKKVEIYILRNNGSSDDAKDVYQEAFIAVWRNVQDGKYSPQDHTSIDGYLYRIAQNKWIDHLRWIARKNKIEPQVPIDISEEEHGSEVTKLEVQMNQLKSSFQVLGEKCKDLLTKFYYDKKNIRLIAEYFGWTEATAKNNKYRCLQKLKEIVNQNNNE